MSQIERKHVRDIFTQAQHSPTSHEKLSKQMKQLYEKMSPDVFLSEFTNCLKAALIHLEKHPVVENSLNFAAKFSVSFLRSQALKPSEDSNNESEEDEEMCPFLLNIFKFLFENHNTENTAIRFRICQFINKLLNSLGDDACIDDNLCDEISECMMERLQDKAPVVRTQALMALHRLQDPSDPNCPVMKAFMFHMSSDPSADVRRAVITNIAITAQSVRSILERTYDVKDVVRRTAYLSLAKLSVQRFTINQRIRLLTDGLKDRSEIVRNCVAKVMVPSWLQYYKGNFLSFLHALDCDSSTEISTLALQTLFKTEPLRNVLEQLTNLLDKDNVIPVDELTPENVLYWRVVSQYLDSHPEIADERPIDEPLPEILPELTTFCNYIRRFYLERSMEEVEHWVKLQQQYVLQQLLELTKGFDLADEMGRANLRQLCLDLLTSSRVSEDVVPVLVEVMVKVVPDVEDRLQSLAEAISEVREPLFEQENAPEPAPQLSPEEIRQVQLKQAMIRVKINEKKEEQDDAIKAEDFLRAQQVKEEWQQLQNELEALAEPLRSPAPVPQGTVRDIVKDRAALCKCLRIVREMVQSDSVKSLTATLRSLMHNFVLPCLQEDNSVPIRNKALEALGLFSLLDQELAKQNFVMFCFQIAIDDVCEVALKVTFDLLHLYGLETFQVEEETGGSSDKKKAKKKKKNLFVTDMHDDEFEDEDDSHDTQSHPSNGSSANTANLIAMLTSLLDSTSTTMRNLAMEGLYKLLMACRITSSALLSRLILMWYSPVTEGDEALRQPLGVFLTIYASHCPRSQETLEQAFLPTLRTLMQAPVVSPLTQVDQDSVARLFISLTRPGTNKHHDHAKNTHIHNNMAISLCNEILNTEDDTTDIGVLLRALLQLELSLDDAVFREELINLTNAALQMFHMTREKQLIRYMEKFRKLIEVLNNTVHSSIVENTAVTEQLDVTQSQSVNTTSSTTLGTKQAKKANNKKLIQLFPPKERREADETGDDSDDDSLLPQRPHSSYVVPASPHSSISQDDSLDEVFEEDKDPPDVNMASEGEENTSASDTVFKLPEEPKRGGRKPRHNTNEKGTRKLSDDSPSDKCPPAKKRKAQKASSSESDTVDRGQSARHSPRKALKASEPIETAEKTANIPQSGKKKEGGASVMEKNSSQAPCLVSVHSMRHINPTEKGAQLRVFQTSPQQVPPKPPRAESKTSSRQLRHKGQLSSSQEDSSPERIAKKVNRPAQTKQKKVNNAGPPIHGSRTLLSSQSGSDSQSDSSPVRPRRHTVNHQDMGSPQLRTTRGSAQLPSVPQMKNKLSEEINSPQVMRTRHRQSDIELETSSSSSSASVPRRRTRMHIKENGTSSSQESGCEEVNAKRSSLSSKSVASGKETSSEPFSTSVQDSSSPGSSRHLRSTTSGEESPPSHVRHTPNSGSSYHLRSVTSTEESSLAPPHVGRTGHANVKVSTASCPQQGIAVEGSSESSPASSFRRGRSGASSTDSSPVPYVRRGRSAVSSPASSPVPSPVSGTRLRGSRVSTPSSLSLKNTPVKDDLVKRALKKDIPKVIPKTSETKLLDSPIPTQKRQGRLLPKGQDSDDNASPRLPVKKLRTPNKDVSNSRPTRNLRSSLESSFDSPSQVQTRRTRISSDSAVKTRLRKV